ncbi:30S ribosomal protein S12 methylthiotransferase RimO [Butyrivibrio sp. VCD2006]|uniref:30S ribosomal protein S12 methylthiotransferase RimO n=1 Tax=Butyrivibrio sp. VCD2006 TaxID=1280664 RepID=UPI00047D65D4|nr:30S ribosomal protein S12 methylthiotransferase RimO [Butyrivibrio sp. VCD2006]
MKILFVSLGCDKNRVDSEVMLGMLSQRGHEFTDDEEIAEAAVVNTCCFIGDAKEESINTIIELGEYRKSGKYKALIVTGCLAERYRGEVLKEIPEVDRILGTASVEHIVEALDSVLAENGDSDILKSQDDGPECANTSSIRRIFLDSLDMKPKGNFKRVQTTGGQYNYLKIAEGCNKNCTYCVIPKVRGKYRSVPMEELIEEAKALVNQGVTEIILVAQETTLYGIDLYGKKSLPELLHRLAEIEDLKWIRIMYCYPEEITNELIETIKNEPKVCNYLDIPLQSGSDHILKQMGRATTRADIAERISYLRSQIPDICIRTTLIAGFPGETEEDHAESLSFIKEMKFDRLGCFSYSQEEETVAGEMPNQLSEEVKNKRRDDIMEAQQEIAFAAAKNRVGQVVSAVIEGRIADDDDDEYEGSTYVARTYMDAPDVDGYLFIMNVPYDLMSGQFVDVLITGSNDYDLIGELMEGKEDENEFTE